MRPKTITISTKRIPEAWQEVYDKGGIEGRLIKDQDIKATLKLEEDALIGYAYDARHYDLDIAMDATYHFWYTRGKVDELRKRIL